MYRSSNSSTGGGTRIRAPLSLLDDNVARGVDSKETAASRKKKFDWSVKSSFQDSGELVRRGHARVNQNNAISNNSKRHAVVKKGRGQSAAAPSASNKPNDVTSEIASKFVCDIFDESQSAMRLRYGGCMRHDGIVASKVSNRSSGGESDLTAVATDGETSQLEMRSSKEIDPRNLTGNDDIVKGSGEELHASKRKRKTADDYVTKCRERLMKLDNSPKARDKSFYGDHNESEMLITSTVNIELSNNGDPIESIEKVAEREVIINQCHGTKCDQGGKHREKVPVAFLGHCQQRLWLDFGDDSLNEVGKTRSIPFEIRAPSSFTSTTSFLIELDRIPFEKGFDIFIGGNLPDYVTDVSALRTVTDSDSIASIQLLQGESKTLHVLWTPVERGSVCEVIHLNLQSTKLEIFLNGVAGDPLLGKESGRMEELGNNANIQEKVPTASQQFRYSVHSICAFIFCPADVFIIFNHSPFCNEFFPPLLQSLGRNTTQHVSS